MKNGPNHYDNHAVELSGVSKGFRGGAPVVDDVSLSIAQGEFMTLLGPSGSGKTTTLNMIAGFVNPDQGQIRLSGHDVARVPVHSRALGMVFQQYSLFPHMTVNENVAFPLKQRKVSKAEQTTRVADALAMVKLGGLGHRKPSELSGGQQQRVALARAMVYRPKVLLMDEPLGALDKSLRQDLQYEIQRLHRDLGLTFVFVTHDQEEALSLSDRIALFKDGRIEQVGTPEELYERPANEFVAGFIGVSNRFQDGRLRTEAGVQYFLCADGDFRVGPGLSEGPTGASLVVRPERIRLVGPTGQRPDNVVRATVQDVTYLGPTRQTRLVSAAGTLVTVVELTGLTDPLQIGEGVDIGWKAPDGRVIAL